MNEISTERAADRGGVLAIHLGTNVGYCFNDRPSVWLLPKDFDHGYIGTALFQALRDFWRLNTPDRILLSDSLDDIEDNEQGRAIATLQVGLVMCIKVSAHLRDVPVVPVHPKAVQAAIFEKTDLSKKALRSATVSLAKRRGFTNLDPDAANALTLFEYGTKVKAAA